MSTQQRIKAPWRRPFELIQGNYQSLSQSLSDSLNSSRLSLTLPNNKSISHPQSVMEVLQAAGKILNQCQPMHTLKAIQALVDDHIQFTLHIPVHKTQIGRLVLMEQQWHSIYIKACQKQAYLIWNNFRGLYNQLYQGCFYIKSLNPQAYQFLNKYGSDIQITNNLQNNSHQSESAQTVCGELNPNFQQLSSLYLHYTAKTIRVNLSKCCFQPGRVRYMWESVCLMMKIPRVYRLDEVLGVVNILEDIQSHNMSHLIIQASTQEYAFRCGTYCCHLGYKLKILLLINRLYRLSTLLRLSKVYTIQGIIVYDEGTEATSYLRNLKKINKVPKEQQVQLIGYKMDISAQAS